MVIKLNGKNIKVSPEKREYLENKMAKLDKFLKPDTVVNVSVSERKELIKVEVFLQYGAKDIKTRCEDKLYKTAVDICVDNLKDQIARAHTQKTNKNRESLRSEYKKRASAEDSELIEEDKPC